MNLTPKNKIKSLILITIICLTGSVLTVQARNLYSDTWVAVDALGRKITEYPECGAPKKDKTVGIFYFLWLGQHGQGGPYDISKMLKENPKDPQYGPAGAFHHWGKSELGYYTSDSEFVIRKHTRMLTDAGVDTLIFDVTNACTYENVYKKICEIYTEMRNKGKKTPQFLFMTHSHSGNTIKKLYDEFYSKGEYKDLWFIWRNKPLILGIPDETEPQLKEFFTIKDCWAWTHGKDKWQWLDHWPQKYAWDISEDKPEEMSVSVAQHPISNIGRSHYNNQQPKPNIRAETRISDVGRYFKQQWERVLEVSPEFLLITGWNEWVAQRGIKKEGVPPGDNIGRKLKEGDSFFVDAYSKEYSRDIEPMEGGYTDNYYYQMVDGIRKYKGIRKPRPASGPKTIKIDGNFEEWASIQPEFRDHTGDTEHRNDKGWGNAGQYINNSGRNDLANMKVSRDDQYLYFYAETVENITPSTDKNWMLLYINIDRNQESGWEGYDYVINLDVKDSNTTTIQKLTKLGKPEPLAEIEYSVNANKMEIAVKRETLGLTEQNKFSLEFHWADNIGKHGKIIEFALNGDSAPERRFNYLYTAE